jgi:hypothetical protein
MPRSLIRRTLASATIAAVAAVVTVAAVGPLPATAAPTTTTATSTTNVPLGGYADIASAGGAITIQDAGVAVPYPAGATFTGLQGPVTDVDVTL